MDRRRQRSEVDPSPAWVYSPDPGAEGDADFDEFTAWLDREAAAGRDPFPTGCVSESHGVTVSFGVNDGIDPELLAAVCGIDPGGSGPGPWFAQGAAADVLPPGPALAALTEAAVGDVSRLSDNQLIGVLQAARRQENREAWKKALVIAEFARRRAAELAAATARGVPVHCRPGQFPGEELTTELLLGPVQTSRAIDDATDLATRLPATLAGMAAGLIDEARAGVIAYYTRSLCPEDTTLADELLAALAPGLRPDQLARKAAALEMKLDPGAAKARREHARRTRQRVEVRREESGNAVVAGREMEPAEALVIKANIHALALQLRRGGLSGSLDELRLMVFSDLASSRDPLRRLAGQDASQNVERDTSSTDAPGDVPPPEAPADEPTETDEDGPASTSLDYDHDEWGDDDEATSHHAVAGPAQPMPAMINLVVRAETLFGWGTSPSEAGGWGLLDGDDTRSIVAAASRHPATRWCLTILGRDGTAVAHGCSPGRHPWTSEGRDIGPPGQRAPTPAQAAQLAAFLGSLNLTLEPIARGSCDHATAESRYVPSRKLAHLVRARTVTCDAPGCNAQAVHADLDHTVPYPEGRTDQCNLGPKCRRHHKVKQSPGWQVEQPEPGVIRWTLPNGRTHTTKPTVYEFSGR